LTTSFSLATVWLNKNIAEENHMAPSIRVTQETYNGLKTMIDSSYGKTINGVIERFLKEEGVTPLEQDTGKTSELEETRQFKGSSFSDAEDNAFRNDWGDSIPNYRFQRDAMREAFNKYNGEKEKTIKAYAWLEEKGHAPRKNNSHNFSAIYYAEALYNDGIKKGWL
jgi:hypothetical protein